MTFVAQSFERFADDLLTALTGGMIREEHRFTGPAELYSLASPGAIAATVKVFGQRNDSFALFEGGVDYDYKSEEGVIVWREEGRPPDDQSYFYVNYYLQEGRRRLTDRNPGGVTTILAEAFAREFAVLHKQMEMIYRSAFVDLATGTSLDHVAALLAINRKDAKFASGEALFKRSTPAEGDITIPAGALVSTDQGQNFETTDKRTLRRGQLSVIAPIRAQVEGPAGRVEAGAIKSVNRPIFGVESVINEAATFFATEKETDEELRRRIKGTLERAGKSTLNAIKFSLIEEVPGVNEGNVQVIEGAEPGKVEVKFGLSDGDDFVTEHGQAATPYDGDLEKVASRPFRKRVPVPPAPIGKSQWYFKVAEGLYDGADYDYSVFATHPDPIGGYDGDFNFDGCVFDYPAAGVVGMAWDERIPCSFKLLAPSSLPGPKGGEEAQTEGAPANHLSRLSAVLPQFKAAGIRAYVDAAKDAWILGESVIRSAAVAEGEGAQFHATRLRNQNADILAPLNGGSQ